MVVRFVCVIRVPVCARVSRVCPVCVPAPPGVLLLVLAAPVSFYRTVPVPEARDPSVLVWYVQHLMQVFTFVVTIVVVACSSFWFGVLFARPNSLEDRRLGEDEHVFYNMAIQHGTDKVGSYGVAKGAQASSSMHSYYIAYSRYLTPLRHQPIKFLEVGLGCNMHLGPGMSLSLWQSFFTHQSFELWMAEYNKECAQKWAHKVKTPILVGDQADFKILQKWQRISGGNFDVIIEDGGHSHLQMLNSFSYLFVHALKPGGVYFMEDIICSRQLGMGYQDGPDAPIDKVTEWVDSLVMSEDPALPRAVRNLTQIKHIESIDCYKGMCAFRKCPSNSDLLPGQTCP